MNAEAILKWAKEIANSQGRLAMSPADQRDRGRVTLCAGSCLARAAIEVNGDQELLADFDRRVLTEHKFDFIPFVFRKHGLAEEAALRAIRENDRRAEGDRLSWFISLDAI